MLVCIVFGTRPEGSKIAPVFNALKRYDINSLVVATAQHRELLDDALSILPVKVDYDLDVMTKNQTPGTVAAAILSGLEKIFSEHKPDVVLVQGDTTSVLASGLAAYYAGIPVCHIEAGLRTHDLAQPYPEEGNRRMLSQIASLHFAPTENAKSNLLSENIPENTIFITGNTIVDALLLTQSRLNSDKSMRESLEKKYPWLVREGKMILATVHRRESFGKPMAEIFKAFRQIIERNRDVYLVYPVHPNPNVRKSAEEQLKGTERIILTEPLDYAGFVYHMMNCHIILTDSGGIQEEAPSLDKPVLVLRKLTERPEALEAGCTRIAGTTTEKILNETERLLNDDEEYKSMSIPTNPFGDGKAGMRIVELLNKNFGE